MSLSTTGDRVRLQVEDEGPGIPEGDRERVWAPFFRLQREVSSAVAGSGIGPAVVGDLVTRHGGRTGVESRRPPQRGSRFYIELPRAADAPVSEVATPSHAVDRVEPSGAIAVAQVDE